MRHKTREKQKNRCPSDPRSIHHYLQNVDTDYSLTLPIWAILLIIFLPSLLLYVAFSIKYATWDSLFSHNKLLARFRTHADPEDRAVEELSKALGLTDEKGLKEETGLLKGIIRFGDETAKEVMTPRSDLVAVSVKTTFPELLQIIVDNVYSRMPVYSGDMDNIVGMLYIKDLLPHLGKGGNFRWQSLVRPAYFVPETKMIDELLREFQINKVHIAVVVDEYGGTSGIVTMEDIIEEIVGEIRDEYDDEERKFVKLNDHTFIFEGKTLLTDFCKALKLDDDTFSQVQGEADTLAGLVLELKGEFPKLHETITYGPYQFEAMQMDPRRINKIKVTLPEGHDEKEPEETEKSAGTSHKNALPFFLIPLLVFLIAACHSRNNDRTSAPTPVRYEATPDSFPFRFERPAEAQLTLAQGSGEEDAVFFDLAFPQEKAMLHCTYRTIQPEELPVVAEESRKLVYFHTARAEKIEEKFYSDPTSRTYGLLYLLEGPVATPRQLALTDSATYFFHASLYFDSGAYEPQKADTLQQIHQYLEHLMETFRTRPE